MSAWLKDNPEQHKAFVKACTDWINEDRSDKPEPRFAKTRAFAIYKVIVPLLQALRLHTLAYKIGGRWGARCSKQQYLSSKTRFFFEQPVGRAAGVIKRWALALIKRRKKQEPWEVLVERAIHEYVKDAERRIQRNARLYLLLKQRGEIGATDAGVVGPTTDEEIADFKKALNPTSEPVPRHYPDYSDPEYDI